MRNLFVIIIVLSLGFISAISFKPRPAVASARSDEKGLKDYFKHDFLIGAAVNMQSIVGKDSALIVKEFNSITPENAMKVAAIHPEENRYNWKEADSIVAFAQKNGIKVRGHNLLWHEYNPAWLFKDKEGKEVSKDVLLKRLHDHITAVVGRYKGKIYTWDVVNEAIDDNPNGFLRNSEWYRICGSDFIAKAFEYAHEADPDAVLVYNDYNSERPEKRERIYMLLKQLVDNRVPVNAVGLQAHWSIYEPSEKDLRDATERFSSLGLKIQFTELDMSVYPWEKERRAKRPGDVDLFTPEREQKQIDQYKMVFKVFADYRSVITGVTFWNVSDQFTWLDNYPVPGRKNYPLLFDTARQRKKAYWTVVKEAK